jgi:hypothetical protein
MFTTVFPPVLTPIPLSQADIYYIYILCIIYIIFYTLYIYIYLYIYQHKRTPYYIYHFLYIIFQIIFIYISAPAHTAALGGTRRPRQDRGDARRGKSGPLCAR